MESTEIQLIFNFLENSYKINGKVAILRFWEVFGQKWRPGRVEMHRNYLCSGMPLRRSFFRVEMTKNGNY